MRLTFKAQMWVTGLSYFPMVYANKFPKMSIYHSCPRRTEILIIFQGMNHARHRICTYRNTWKDLERPRTDIRWL